MPRAPASPSIATDRAFRYVGGDPSLDLSNTVVWAREGPLRDRLVDYPSVVTWAEGAGVITRSTARKLRSRAASHTEEADRAFQDARWLRWTLHRVFAAVASGRRAGAALADLDRFTARALRHRRLGAARGSGAEWCWDGMGTDLASPLWPVALAAAALLTSEEAERITMCDGLECGWVFVDRSRNGLRRWCEMETCGTSAKTRRRAARRATAPR